MESEVTHKLRLGDVFIEKDGWGKMCMRVGLTSSEVGFFAYVSGETLAAAIDKCRPTKLLRVEKDWVFLFNVCDVFKTARGALTNDDSNP